MNTEPITCTHLTSIENIQKLMESTNTKEIFVVDTLLENHLLGTIKESDILKESSLEEVKPESLSVEQCMKPVSITVRETASFEECYGVLNHYDIAEVPVVDEEGHLCGVYNRASLNLIRQ